MNEVALWKWRSWRLTWASQKFGLLPVLDVVACRSFWRPVEAHLIAVSWSPRVAQLIEPIAPVGAFFHDLKSEPLSDSMMTP